MTKIEVRNRIVDMLIETQGENFIFLIDGESKINVNKRGPNRLGIHFLFTINIQDALLDDFFILYFSPQNGINLPPIVCREDISHNLNFHCFL